MIGTSAAGNVISGNASYGVYVTTATTTGTSITNNRIGTTADGMSDLGNSSHGIYVTSAGSVTITNNLVSGNDADGIRINNTSGTTLRGNTIGLNAAGTASLVNNNSAIVLTSASSTMIGGAANSDGNVINANTGNFSVYVYNSSETTIEGNLIGTDAAGTACAQRRCLCDRSVELLEHNDRGNCRRCR